MSRRDRPRNSLVAFGWPALLGLGLKIHQVILPNRSFSVLDLIYNSLEAAIGTLFILAMDKWRIERRFTVAAASVVTATLISITI